MAERYSIVCAECKAAFFVPNHRRKTAKFCSASCAAKRSNKTRNGTTIEARFWRKVLVLGENDCWKWIGAATRGHGQMKGRDGKNVPAQTLAYRIASGDDSVFRVTPTCGNGLCCNPKHLVKGSAAQIEIAAQVAEGRGKIYALIDPTDGMPRYVGSTTQRLSVRLAQHRLSVDASPRWSWVASLISRGISPKIELLERCGVADLLDKEREWIHRLGANGVGLLNVYDPNMSAPRPPSSRAKISEFRRGYRGWRHSEETKQKIGRSGSENSNAKLCEGDVCDIRARCLSGETQRSVANAYGVTFQTVNDIVRRKTWRHIE